MEIKDKDSFCVYPWVHTHLNTEGDVYPCCVSWTPERQSRIGWLEKDSLEDLFNNDKMKQLRLDMIAGKKRPDICDNCYKREDAGFHSARQGANVDFKNELDNLIASTHEDGYVEPVIKSWDIRFSNLCNLKCRSCGPMFSNTWAQEEKKAGAAIDSILIHPIENDTDPMENQYDNVEKIYFAGGEPLIMPEHYTVLRGLINKGVAHKVHIIYNTNMTKLDYNNNDILDLWKQFKKVVLGVSIDAVGPRAEYIRHGMKWHVIEENLKKLKQYCRDQGNLFFYFSPTVSLQNIHHMTDMHRYLVENNCMSNIDAVMFNILLQPLHYDMRGLPDMIKDEITDRIDEHIEWCTEQGALVIPTFPEGSEHNEYVHDRMNAIKEFNTLKDYIQQPIEFDKNSFVDYTEKLDKRRNESFTETFPEYAEWYRTIRQEWNDR